MISLNYLFEVGRNMELAKKLYSQASELKNMAELSKKN